MTTKLLNFIKINENNVITFETAMIYSSLSNIYYTPSALIELLPMSLLLSINKTWKGELWTVVIGWVLTMDDPEHEVMELLNS